MIKILMIAALFIATSAHADKVAYNREVRLTTESNHVKVVHLHNALNMTSRSEFYLPDNQIKPVNSPMLSHLIFDKRSKLFVGLSNIKYRGNAQIIIWNQLGEELAQKSFSCEALGAFNCIESTTNWIHWFNEEDIEFNIIMGSNSIPKALIVKEPEHHSCLWLSDKEHGKEYRNELINDFGLDYFNKINCAEKTLYRVEL